MRKLALTLTVALVVGGCTSETEIAQEASRSGGKSQTTSAQSPRNPQINTGRAIAFASLPDQGTLLAFDRSRKPVQRGAYTYHAVQLSEAHALNAAVAGKSIDLPLPSGETMRIAYQRHEEALDGNWSWIGKTKDGLDAVITFGEGAVFGRIYQKDTEAYSLTMSGGRSWLVQTDPSKVFDGNLGRDAGESDALIPPSVAAAVNARKLSAAAAVEGGGKASAANTVDVVLGYTNGLVSKYGSAANATTRLSNLMAITNQAYANSLITPRVRLVRTVQVNYTDSNTNELALEALTGYDCTATSCTPQTVPAELVPLRTARDEYGADLVSLVRPFQAPQHQGCGIAWLLGGGGFAIDNTDAPFGYSIVSDGNDQDEGDGRNYFCREETLAHELGHNMGQQHNTEDSGGDSGTHPYSYGYREALTTGFYTVMAYRLANSSQTSINYFANPSVNAPGTSPARPTGTATADNARSLNISMPLVAQFRNSVVPFGGKVRNDLNGNGTSDLIWFNTTSSTMAYWWINNTTIAGTGQFAVGSTFRIAGTGDLDGDGRADIIWRDSTTNYHYLWRSRGDGQFDTPFLAAIGPGWTIAQTADLNADGRDDLVWENVGTGQMAYWMMNGTSVLSTGVFTVGSAYRIVGTGDFDGDGRGDILWANASAGYLYLWRSRGDGTFDTPFVAAYGTAWAIAGTPDLNGDGRSDIVWENTGSGQMAYWWMNGATTQSTGVFTVGTAFRVATTGDFDGDGRGDIVWANASSGFLYLWRSRGDGTFDTPFLASYSSAWSIIR